MRCLLQKIEFLNIITKNFKMKTNISEIESILKTSQNYTNFYATEKIVCFVNHNT